MSFCPVVSLFRPFFLLIAVAFIFVGSALAADDRRSPTTQHLSLAFQAPSNSGEDLYQFWCSTCHGDRGQGLTPAWRATWPKDKQNCWQAKCHASSHPPDGFTIPKNVPALIGPDTLHKFSTAQDLYIYISAAMPYWSPNLLKEDEYRAITVFLIKANYQEKGYPAPVTLPSDWTTFALHPGMEKAVEPIAKIGDFSPQPIPTPSVDVPAPSLNEPPTSSPASLFILPSAIWWLLSVIVIGSMIIFFCVRRFFFQPR